MVKIIICKQLGDGCGNINLFNYRHLKDFLFLPDAKKANRFAEPGSTGLCG